MLAISPTDTCPKHRYITSSYMKVGRTIYIYTCLDVLSLNISWTYCCQSHPVSLLVVFSRFLKSLDAFGIVTACLDNLLNQKLFDWLTLLNCFQQGSQKTWKPGIQHTRILPGKPQTRWTEAWKQVEEKMPTTLHLNRNKLRHALELTARGIVTVCAKFCTIKEYVKGKIGK